MKIKTLYSRMRSKTPIERAEFLDLAERALGFFTSLYGAVGMAELGEEPDGTLPFSSPLTIDDDTAVSELYAEAILSYIEYLLGGEGAAYNRAITSAEGAYRTLWRRRASGKRLRPR